MTTQWFLVSAPPPPDLTDYIDRINDQYVDGGSFGDVYKCWYRRDGSAPQEVRATFTRSPLGPPSIYFPSGCGKGVAVQVRVTRRYKGYIHQGIHFFRLTNRC